MPQTSPANAWTLFKDRVKSQTPIWFKRILRWGLIGGGLGFSLILFGDNIPAGLHTIATYLVAVGGTAAFVAKQATSDKDLAEKSDEFLKNNKT